MYGDKDGGEEEDEEEDEDEEDGEEGEEDHLGPPVLHVLARGPDTRGLAHLLCKTKGNNY